MASLNALRTWQRRGLYATVALLALSGAAWLTLHYGVGSGDDGLPHPLEAWLLRLHGAAGFAALFFSGVLAANHVPRGWHTTWEHPRQRSRRGFQRRSGVVLCSLGVLLATSGYVLYYFTPEAARPALGIAHAVIGLVLSMLLPTHVMRRSPPVGH